ncbi:RnfH family protein [Atopomonas sediminilitoris]|uniref:RnfH family protein n=1 Tax=Atopomonas sediminilitoris TaxID=2919919 RepID=UPI001F4D954D|nr:RnfH family protein [Atopomonas sediminilitoris]MCJ8169859.1 RnfH family protein [Atopomonas sediminilitoris]
MAESEISVEVAYATPERQELVKVKIAHGASMLDAARAANLQRFFPQLDVDSAPMGIFGKAVAKPEQRVLEEGERVEIYRPLIADPKEVRKQRAAKLAQEKAAEKNKA